MSPGETARQAVVIGPYRVHNFGDDLVGAILAKHLQSQGYSVTVPRLGRANARWLGTTYASGYDSVYDEAELVVVGGGGIMSDTSGAKPGASYLEAVARAALSGHLRGKRVVITSVGAGPWILERSKMLAFGVSLLADRIGVRDSESYEHLASIGITGDKVVLGADCALLSADYLDFAPESNGKMGVQFNVQQFLTPRDAPRLNRVSDVVRRYVERNAHDVMLLSNGPSASPLAESAPTAQTLEYTELQSFLPRLSGLTSMFTSHLHLAITAFSQRIPTFSLYVREKTKRFYEQIGRPERAIDLRHASPGDARRFLAAAEAAVWTEQDEDALQRLKKSARGLLEFVR